MFVVHCVVTFIGRRPYSFLGLSFNERTILFLVILLDKTVFALGRSPYQSRESPRTDVNSLYTLVHVHGNWYVHISIMSTAGENIFWTFSYSVLIIVYRVYSLSAIIYFPNGLRYIFLRLTDLNRPGDGESPMAQMCTNKKLPVIHEKNNVLLSELIVQGGIHI